MSPAKRLYFRMLRSFVVGVVGFLVGAGGASWCIARAVASAYDGHWFTFGACLAAAVVAVALGWGLFKGCIQKAHELMGKMIKAKKEADDESHP